MDKKLLIVDDSIFFRTQMAQVLSEAGYQIILAVSGEECLQLVKAEKPDLVLLDIVMPGMDGFEVCRILREAEGNTLMPILMLTSRDAQDDKLIGLELGADDYITKPFNKRELLSRIRNTLRRIDRNRAANPLTGLDGNIEIQREINSRIATGRPYAVIYGDLDNFKSFNDIYGFARGDLLIKLTADILMSQSRLFGCADDLVGHIGGDDFALVTTPDKAAKMCREIILHFDERARTLYDAEDVARGYISSVNRKGIEEVYPLASISLAVVSNVGCEYESHIEVGQLASDLKHKLKAMPGSNYLAVPSLD